MKKTVTFGEIMLRLAPNGYNRFFQENQLQATFGGGEANVAVSIANYGLDSLYITKLPNNDIGQGAVNSLRYFGVDTSKIVRGGERVGIYYLEKGASQRPSKVIYDRAHSAISTANRADFDWDSIFEGASWYHFTGITPALSDTTAQICLDSLMVAKKKNIKVSCDLNYRKNLWSKAKAHQTMSKLMEYVDVCIGNEEDAYDVFGISASGTDVEKGKVNKDGYAEVAEKLKSKYNFEQVAITLRTSISANDNLWAGMLYCDKAYFSKEYNLHIVDRVGGGDSFSGGLIYALCSNYTPKDAIEFAVATSALKHSVEGDFNRVSVKEAESLMRGNASGRVQR